MPPVLHVPAFKDNYIWLIRGDARDHVAIVDPGDAAPVFAFLEQRRLTPAAILCTHHHGDHVGGVPDLLSRYDVPVYGPGGEHIPDVTHPLGEGDRVELPALNVEFRVLDIPGHTAGHIAYVGGEMLFCGDTLFSAGCGRLFEGTAEQMHASLTKLADLPGATAVYCGHEYTVANLRFALAVEPQNADARGHLTRAEALRTGGEPTLPSTIGLERRINPFLRSAIPTVRQAAESQAGQALDSPTSVFAVLRRWKDDFKG